MDFPSGVMDLSQLGKPKEPKALSFNKQILRLKNHLPAKEYTLRLCDEAIACGIMTVKEFRLLAKRYSTRPERFTSMVFEQLILNRIKKAKEDHYWEQKNHSANSDIQMDQIINANKNKGERGK